MYLSRRRSNVVIQKPVKDIIKQVSIEMNLPIDTVTDIYMSQFKFVVDEMKKGTRGEPESFKNILLKYLGTFKISGGKVYYITKQKLEKEANEKKESE